MSAEESLNFEDAVSSMSGGATLAELRGLERSQMPAIASVVEHLVEQNDLDSALAGCRFLCTHDHNNTHWWMLQGKIARSARNFRLSVVSLLTGFATDPDPDFCVELARTYLAAENYDLASQAVETGEILIEDQGGHEKTAASLSQIKQELSRHV